MSQRHATSTNPEVLAKCPEAIQAAHDKLPMLRRDLIILYAEVAKAAPSARIVVTGYPHLFEPTAPYDPDIILAVNNATDALNATIRQAVSVTNDADINIHYVDVTEEFAGHGIGCTEPCTLFINNLPDREAFHPTAEGYAAYAEAIKTKLPGGWLDKNKQLV
jgi:lysophospholipase L1-like esterase